VLAGLAGLIATHGYWVVAVVIMFESMGIPLPGETMLVTAAIFAGTTHQLNIAVVIVAAAAGAIVGDNLGFGIGRRYGVRLLRNYGHLLRITPSRIRLGQYLFDRHGGKVVFFGRFVAVMRALAALLAGVNCMNWWRFLIFNAAGGIVWATLYGSAAYIFGEQVERLRGPVAVLGIIGAGVAVIVGTWLMRRHEQTLSAHVERTWPGPQSIAPIKLTDPED
jgi:membrane protein DedA with SNARE-associated domain